MAIAFVQSATQQDLSGQSDTVAITLTGVTAGSCLVLTGSIRNSNTTFTVSGVSDGNSYTVRTSARNTYSTSSQFDIVAYLTNVSAGTHTVTVTLSGANAGDTRAVLQLTEFSGVAASDAEDTWDAGYISNANASDVFAGPITTTDAGCLIVGSASFMPNGSGGNTWGSPSGWTNVARNNYGYSTATAHDSAYWIPGSIQTDYSAQWSHDNDQVGWDTATAVIVALKEGVGGGATASTKMAFYRMLRTA